MLSYEMILLSIVVAELMRRCCKACWKAFVGPMAKVPGPWAMKLSGLPWALVVIQGNQINESPRLFAKYGDIVRVAPDEILIASKSAIQKVVAEYDLPKSPLYETLRERPDVTNLFTERDNTAYKKKRRLLSIGFSINYTNGLEPLMQDCVQMFITSLQKKCYEDNGFAVVDFFHMFANLSFDVMSAASFGGSFELSRTDNSKLTNMFHDRLKKTCLNTLFPFLKYLPFMPSLRSPEMDEMIQGIISKRRKAMEAREPKQDLLQVLIDTHDANPEEFTMMHVHEEMRVFMVAGSETAAETATFTILLLLNNPSKLQLLLSELNTSFSDPNSPTTFANTQNLQYLNECINETMRLMPMVRAGIPRVTEKTTVLDGFEIPGGVIIYAHIDAMQRDRRYFYAADQFVPERWGSDQAQEVDRKAFMPFSAGLRSCPGQQFALKELRLLLVTLLRNFELSLVEGQSHEMRVHTAPYFVQGKYLVGVKPRV